jgi:hypothetical protein
VPSSKSDGHGGKLERNWGARGTRTVGCDVSVALSWPPSFGTTQVTEATTCGAREPPTARGGRRVELVAGLHIILFFHRDSTMSFVLPLERASSTSSHASPLLPRRLPRPSHPAIHTLSPMPRGRAQISLRLPVARRTSETLRWGSAHFESARRERENETQGAAGKGEEARTRDENEDEDADDPAFRIEQHRARCCRCGWHGSPTTRCDAHVACTRYICPYGPRPRPSLVVETRLRIVVRGDERGARMRGRGAVGMRSCGALRRMGTGTVSPGVDFSTTRSFAMHILLRLVPRVSALGSGPNTSRTVLEPSLRMHCMRCTASPGCRDYAAPASELETLDPLFVCTYIVDPFVRAKCYTALEWSFSDT